MPRGSPVELKSIFIKIIVEMLMRYSPLMSTQQPSFKQSCYSVAVGQQMLSHFSIFAYNLMNVLASVQTIVSVPAVRTIVLPGSTLSQIAGSKLTAEASAIRRSRIRPYFRPSTICTAIRTKALPSAPLPRLPGFLPPI